MVVFFPRKSDIRTMNYEHPGEILSAIFFFYFINTFISPSDSKSIIPTFFRYLRQMSHRQHPHCVSRSTERPVVSPVLPWSNFKLSTMALHLGHSAWLAHRTKGFHSGMKQLRLRGWEMGYGRTFKRLCAFLTT